MMQKQLSCLNFKDTLIDLLRKAVKELGIDIGNQVLSLEIPKENIFGDLSSNVAMRFCQFKKTAPMHLAREIVESLGKKINKSTLAGKIEKIDIAAPGFINFYINKIYLEDVLKEILILKDNFGRPKKSQKAKVLLEFVSANPTGPLSIAHARQAAIGTSIASILEFLRYKVCREYYLNDYGNQMRILGKSISLRLKELKGDTITFPEDGYQGQYVYDIAKQIIDNDLKPETDDDFIQIGLDYIMNLIRKDLEDFGVNFDNWYSQKKLESSNKIKNAFSILRKKGFIYQLDGATWFKSTALGDDKDRVIIKSDGSYTYLSPDIAYHQDKYKRGFDWLINIWGPDHHGYIPRLVASVCALGHPKESISILIAQLVTLKQMGQTISMSTRQAKYVTLRQLLDEVGKDASHYFLISRRVSSHLDFDLEIAKKQSNENPVYYIQYAHARIASIVKKSNMGKLDKNKISQINFSHLKFEEEVCLAKALFNFSYIVDFCANILDAYPLTIYLLDLAGAFHRFYDKYKVLCDDKELSLARFGLVCATKIVFESGLKLINISAPEEM